MPSLADLQARARARNAQAEGQDPPDAAMDDASGRLEDEGGDGSDNDVPVNNANTRHNLPARVVGEAEAFQRMAPSAQLVHIFIALQEIHSFIATLPPSDERWRITASFEKNVKTYTKALFVQPTVKNYNSATIIDYMGKTIKRLRWGLPAGAENNPVLWKEVVTMIRDTAADFRSDWKKEILASIAAKQHISELASAVTSSIDGFTPDGPFLVRLAVLRTICTKDSSTKYWPAVARELADIQSGENPNQVLAEYFLEDQNTYPKSGVAPLNANFTSTPSSSSIRSPAGILVIIGGGFQREMGSSWERVSVSAAFQLETE
ncbi:hypothetical protein BDM02DRAFT_3191274 [Thelephora ganbajun]|uniref:Uncharacterized protein n=1 Tax=Thelephora ganbajun TaxID=370292 RepID=A0ACB6Z2E9_THEGA|nr:hypothetical protein BDM02DRAFT_3191274 [Thelephora ganbajun]